MNRGFATAASAASIFQDIPYFQKMGQIDPSLLSYKD
jgi:hypothetical protein